MSPTSSRSSLRSWFGHLPEALLIAVALSQIALAFSHDLLAWKGGGFGMFARLDAVEFREIRVRDREGLPIELSSQFYRVERRCKIHPRPACLAKLAADIEAEEQGVAEIEVFRTEFRGVPLRPQRERIAALELRRSRGK